MGGKWRLLIIQVLAENGGGRYRDIKQSIPGISDKVLSDELRAMEENLLIERREDGSKLLSYVNRTWQRGSNPDQTYGAFWAGI
ncbi:MAG: winged helix-turn-helix transcriptional regulator [Bacteroidota bacterium]